MVPGKTSRKHFLTWQRRLGGLLLLPEAFDCGNIGDVWTEESHGGGDGSDEHGEERVVEGVGHQGLQLGGGGAGLLLPHPGQDERIVGPNPEGDDHCQDVHEGEEWESEDEGVGEVCEAKRERNGSDGGDGDGEAGGEAPDREEDQEQSKEEVRGVLYQVSVEQSVLQSCE